jgi:hypothetical protein
VCRSSVTCLHVAACVCLCALLQAGQGVAGAASGNGHGGMQSLPSGSGVEGAAQPRKHSQCWTQQRIHTCFCCVLCVCRWSHAGAAPRSAQPYGCLTRP